MRALLAYFVIATAHAAAVRENPIRKVVTVLQGMSKETEMESDRAQELFDKFMCYCQTNEADLTKNVEEARAHVDELTSGIKELSGSNAQLEQELKDLNEDVADNTKAVEEATSQRKKEADAFAAESTETTNSIGSLDKAIPALKKGLEEPSAVLAAIGSTVAKANGEQSALLQAFMHGGHGSLAGSGGTDQILGILEQMRDDFKANLGDMTKEEEEAITTFTELTDAKKKQIAAATEEINEKGGRVAQQTQQISDFQEDLDDTSAGLAQDEKFLSTLKQNCATKTKEHEAMTKARQEELVGISEAIKILNSDDALELLKKTVPQGGAYFLQTSMKKRRSALARIASKATYHEEEISSDQALSFVQTKMQMRAPQVDLAPLKKRVTDMITDLKAEQEDDDAKFKQCKAELATAADEKATLETTMSNADSKMETIKNEVHIIKEEMEVLATEIAQIDKSMAEATAQRKKEKAEFSATASELAMTVDLLGRAKAVLERMYQPKAAAAEFVQSRNEWENSLTSFLHMDQPGPPPETASYSNKGAAGMGVVGMLNTMIADVKAQQTAGKKEEDDSQADFEQVMADMGDSKKAKKKDTIGKEAALSRLLETEADLKGEMGQNKDEYDSVVAKEHALHESCDFLLENYEERKKARTAEIESVNNAFSILSGADFGLLQSPQSSAASFFQAAAETTRVFRHSLHI
jgi:chromosome segregation ATPase